MLLGTAVHMLIAMYMVVVVIVGVDVGVGVVLFVNTL